MPVLRYFCVIGLCLLGLIFAAGHFMPPADGVSVKAEAANDTGGGSLASWRQAQQNLTKPQAAAVVYPDVASLPPTAERLQFERQMTFRKPDSPALQARAELPSAAEAITPGPAPSKAAAKIPSRPRTVARADRRERPNYAAAYPPAPAAQFGGYRQAQFDRSADGFFNFRMF